MEQKALAILSQHVEVTEAIEQALTVGDLAKLDPAMRVQYYNAVCLSVGLNPLTRPFDFLKDMGGRLQIYARKEAAEQLRKIHRVSIKETGREWIDEHILCITVTASMPDGREEDEMGAVYLANDKGEPFTGQNRANAIMKTLTKAKRRATLAICGLGFDLADENGRHTPAFDPHTGEIKDEPTTITFVPGPDEATNNLFDDAAHDSAPQAIFPSDEESPVSEEEALKIDSEAPEGVNEETGEISITEVPEIKDLPQSDIEAFSKMSHSEKRLQLARYVLDTAKLPLETQQRFSGKIRIARAKLNKPTADAAELESSIMTLAVILIEETPV